MDAVIRDLHTAVDDRLSTRLFDRRRMAHDASHYLLEPFAVVVAENAEDVAAAVRIAHQHQRSVTFRSGGTSLSGQSVSDGIIIDTRQHFRGVEVLDGGERVRCQPGATVRQVNARLALYRRILGPDPASESACTIGGVVANNSSGMSCGTIANTYETLDSLRFVLVTGTMVDTSREDCDQALRAAEPELWRSLAELRDRVRSNPQSLQRIRHQFSMKNTMGYGLNSLVDFDEPAQILAHLMIGSEGTLGFILDATFVTLPIHAHMATALCIFDAPEDATAALPSLVAHGVRTAEFMDAASLRVTQRGSRKVRALEGLNVDRHTALLVEVAGDSVQEMDELHHGISALFGGFRGLAQDTRFTTDPVLRAEWWHVRKGLYTAVAGARPSGSTALLEDVVVPMPQLADTVSALTRMCNSYGYDDAVQFGHAKDGNLHFMINPNLSDETQLGTYARFTDDLVDLILEADGSLKAEHGTGRIMAPFVRRQYGDELYDVMVRIKRACDPGNTLNPGVIITEDAHAHLRDLKPATLVDAQVDRCVECGYCEPVCPSKDLTTTPRQRIAILRDMSLMNPEQRAEMEKDYDYDAIDTCAVDSLCMIACPVDIDTGVFMKSLRTQRWSKPAQKVGETLAKQWGPVLGGLRAGMHVADHVPSGLLTGITRAARIPLSKDLIPLVGDDLPSAGADRKVMRTYACVTRGDDAEVAFFPSCLSEIFSAADPQSAGAAGSFLHLCGVAGAKVRVVDGVEKLCCTTVWSSKGLTLGRDEMARRTAEAVLTATDQGRIPVVSDASSCSHGLHEIGGYLRQAGEDALAQRFDAVHVMDSTRYTAERLLDRLGPVRRLASVVLHPTCTDRHEGNVPALQKLAEACAEEVVVPIDAGCCGFAGDRGMLHPELTASATRAEAAEVIGGTYDAHLSSNRTCELGMSRATGKTYRHVLEVLAEMIES
ncbi:FAD-binding oxidoreductase [Tessaracoccus antarcticus]|uniref:D-lactate dehydrogenase (cytochrome) n=2 Tax=Tessaracoccus antarcticus TaxID=2479848 RepID=A0A3M0GBM2_9ACTN|nr:FAD-binding oxidoreductase [Tessaracoccus antarcticus]